MEDNFSKLFRLFGTLFLSFIGFLLALALLMLSVRLLFGVLSYISWIDYVYMIIILAIPTALFITVYIIYYKRTVSHRSAGVRWISYVFFAGALIAWIIFFMIDMFTFFPPCLYGCGDVPEL